ncbi:MAG: PAS domain-containing protein [Alphaproteobacteria bacterium]|nr:PAS domain-containing protein [Alphaproteobacteria bacterium]
MPARRPPGKLPGRQHVEPTEIVELLPWIMMIEVIAVPDAETRYRIRLVGTEVVAIQGSDGTGKYVEEVLDTNDVAAILRGYGEILRTRRPEYRAGIVATTGREHVPYRRVAFPLARDGEHVDMLLFVFVRDEKART